MPIDPKRVQAVFVAAIAESDAEAQAAFLDQACATEPELRQRVEALLRAHQNPATILDRPDTAGCDTALATGFSGDDSDTTAASPRSDLEVTRTIWGDDDYRADSVLGYLEPSTKTGVLGRLGHYEVLKILGRGGFGVVLKAFDEVLHRVVAIKMMSTEMAATSPARKRFLREARASAAVRHENVVQIYAVEEQPIPYLVMEFIPGQSLQQLLDQNGPLDVQGVLRIGSQVARGLAAAHAMGLVHRDIKPANILVEESLEVRAKLTDFGLARAADDASLTQSGLVAGTPMYMSPEQTRGESVDYRTDLFSLGSVLYVTTTGRPPFRASSAIAVLKRVNEDSPRPIREIIPETPQWLCNIIAKLHAKDPAQRFQSAREVADLLSDCLEQVRQHGKLNDSSRIPKVTAARGLAWRRWVVAALLLPVLAIATTERAGITSIFARRESTAPQAEPVNSVAPSINVPQNESLPTISAGALPPTFSNSLGMNFVLVPKGRFWKGGRGGVPGEDEVRIAHDFYLGVYEVTQGEWEAVLGKGKNPSRFARNGDGSAAVAEISDEDLKRFPVDSVSWDECQEFLERLNEKVREKGWTYRLPTSAEWEYACRGGPGQSKDDAGFDFYFDTPTDTLAPDKANFKETGLNRTCKVGSYPPNRLKLHDMHGNVFEYCDNIITKGDDSLRILRGGGWLDEPEFCRAGNSNQGSPSGQYNGGGLRVARVPVGDDK